MLLNNEKNLLPGSQNYIQLFQLRNLWSIRATSWLSRQEEQYSYLTISTRNTEELMIIGFGSFFYPIIRDGHANCLCLPEKLLTPFFDEKKKVLNFPKIKKKDLSPLAQFLRLGDA